LSQLIWAIVVPIPGHLDVYSGSEEDVSREDHYHHRGSARDARRTYKSAHGRFGQFYGRFYRHGLSLTDTRKEFTGFIGLYGHRVQLFLVLATYCAVLGPIPSTKHLVSAS